MGKVNVCLKRSFIIVASLIGIISALLLAITLFGHGHLHDKEEFSPQMQAGVHLLYIICIATLVLIIIGVFGACKKKTWALILFAVGMILGSLFMFVSEVHGLASRPQMAEEFKKEYLVLRPLANASESFKFLLEDAQRELHCCGLDQGYMDWGYIPDSCECHEVSSDQCVEAPAHLTEEHTMIYKEPCLTFLVEDEIRAATTVLGVMLGITLVWVLAAVLSICILCQLNQKNDTPTVVYSPEAKAGNYTTLTEPADYS